MQMVVVQTHGHNRDQDSPHRRLCPLVGTFQMEGVWVVSTGGSLHLMAFSWPCRAGGYTPGSGSSQRWTGVGGWTLFPIPPGEAQGEC